MLALRFVALWFICFVALQIIFRFLWVTGPIVKSLKMEFCPCIC